MIYYVARFTFREAVTPEQKEEALERLRAHGRIIPSITFSVVGRDFGGEFEWAAVFGMEDLAGYEEHMRHPEHVVTDRMVLPLVEHGVRFDIADDPDPEVGARITEMRRHRLRNDAEAAALVAAIPSSNAATDLPSPVRPA
ncbi:Dabb family protein [Actinoplanes sp. NPDC049316]|uniref:Dabb family protein n=1 Tax=Actinoplanes sp. NPDC049316 TaxID=3154727 RepID=UPI003437B432